MNLRQTSQYVDGELRVGRNTCLESETCLEFEEVQLSDTRTLYSLAALACVVLSNAVFADEPLDDVLSTTFRIAQGDHSGTCFLLKARPVDPPEPQRFILATAAHVLDQMSNEQCDLVLRSETADAGYARKVVLLQIRDKGSARWTRHPDVDIATMLVTLPEDAAVRPFGLDDIADETRVANRTIRVGREVWISCFPAKLESNEAGWPVLRRGTIASHPLVPVKSVKTLFVDYSVFGGDSGAPVTMLVDDRPLIVGVASAMQRQTDRSTLPFEEKTMHTPLALSVVVQGAYLRETIELMYGK